MQLDVNHGPKVNGHCPSVDVLFDSVADQIGNSALGVILQVWEQMEPMDC